MLPQLAQGRHSQEQGEQVPNVIKLCPNHTKKLSSFLKVFFVVYMSWTLKQPPCDGLRQDADASVNRRGLRREASPLGHGCELVDLGSGGRFSENEWPAAEVVAVLGLVPRAEQFCEETHGYHTPLTLLFEA